MTIDLQQCWSITCRGCGKPLEGGPEDDRSLMLFFAPDAAIEAAIDCEWSSDGSVCWCPSCTPSEPPGTSEGSQAAVSDWYRLFCDHCGEEYEDSEDGHVVFQTPAKAVEAALVQGWTTDGRRWHCGLCSEDHPVGEGTAWVHIPIPGQGVLL